MQNRLYAVAILVILGICCLGIYIALTQFNISRNPFSIAAESRTPVVFTPIIITIATDTPAPVASKTSGSINPTAGAPTLPGILFPSPSVTSAATSAPTGTARPSASTTQPQPSAAPSATTVPAATTNCGAFQFCNAGGPPDSTIASGSIGCPSNYIWGRVVDLTGKGLADRKIRYRNSSNESLPPVNTKGAPDVPGKYDIPTGAPGGTWVVWLQSDDGNQASPQVTITTSNYSGAGNCPNRIDFKQAR